MTAPRDGANQMRNAGMTQRLGSSNPNGRGVAGNNFPNPLVRNRMAGIVMQDFGGIQELDGARIPRETEYLREAGSDDVRRQTQGEPHHRALKPAAQPEFAGLEFQRDVLFGTA
jgi:hypothetical protein